MPPLGFTSTVAALLTGTVALSVQASEASGVLFMAPFSLGPLFVSLGLAMTWWHRPRAQSVLAIGTAVYALFFGYCYLSAFHWHVDAQSPILLVFIGIYSLPVMLIFWIVAWRRGRDGTASCHLRNASLPCLTDMRHLRILGLLLVGSAGLAAYVRHLRKEPLRVEEQVAYYQKYWQDTKKTEDAEKAAPKKKE